jgi:DHA2 family multidrug resistance protein
MMLDRGELLGWFDSNEVVIEAALAVAGFYLFLAHSFTSKAPVFPLQIFKDRNFVVGLLFMFIVGIILLATMALITPYIQNVMGYPVMQAGLLLGTRGLGTLVSMMLVGRLLRRIDARILIFIGLSLSTWSLSQMVYISPETSAGHLNVINIAQGFGLGFIFVPLNTLAFATLPAQYRTTGTALWTLIRSIGSSVGISIVIAQLTSGITQVHSQLMEHVTPFNQALAGAKLLDPTTAAGRSLLESMVARQATIISYANDYQLMTWISLAAFPLLLLIKGPRKAGK